jgi:hypothetical protein
VQCPHVCLSEVQPQLQQIRKTEHTDNSKYLLSVC